MENKNKKKSIIEYNWIFKIVIASFIISVFFSFVSEMAIPNVNIFFSILIAILFIVIGVVFDMVGVSVATADESVYHSMASKKVKGAKMAIQLKKNASKVSSFCNDVVGDICGIVSGSAGAVISIKLSNIMDANNLIITLIVMGIISSLTIGGKAIFKSFAMKRSNNILYKFARVLSIFKK